MIRVDRNSWHYRLQEWFQRRTGIEPARLSLCTYFWITFVLAPLLAVALAGWWLLVVVGRVVLLVVVRPVYRLLRAVGLGRAALSVGKFLQRHGDIIGTGVAVGVLTFGGGLLSYILVLAFLDSWGWTLIGIGIFAAGLLLLIAAVVAAASVTDGVKRRRRERPPTPSPRPPKKSRPRSDGILRLLWGYISARKRKVCPLIEIVDD